MIDDVRNQGEEVYRQAQAAGELAPAKFKCDICHQLRLADELDVIAKPIIREGVNIGVQRIRFCATRDECRAMAKTFEHIPSEDTPKNADND
jgi:hypothetical protein